MKGSYLSPFNLFILLTALAVGHSESNTSNCIGQTDGTLYPVANTCESYIYCLANSEIILPCPQDTSFSEAAQNCVVPSKSDCVLKTTITTPPLSSTTMSVTVASCIDNEKRIENQKACKGQPLGELVSYPGNCARFLVCNCEYPTVMECPGGLWFNSALKVCDWPHNVECESTPTKATPKPTASTPEVTTSASTKTETRSTVTQSTPTRETTTTPKSTESTPQYTTAAPTSPLTTSTPENTTTPQTSRTTPEPTKTTHTPTTPITQQTSTIAKTPTTTTTTPSLETTTAITTTTSVSPSALCEHEQYGTTFPVEDNSKKYIFCTGNGSFLILDCPRNNYYNPSTGSCGPSASSTSTPETTTTTPNPTKTTSNLTITTPRATTTTPYTTTTPSETSSPTTPIISTTAPNFSTNAPSPTTSPSPATTSTSPTTTTPMTTTTLKTTTSASDLTTTSNPSALCEHEEFGTTFPNKDNSAEYIFCTGDGSYQILPCPGNTFYNPSTGSCGPSVSPTSAPETTTTTPNPTKTTSNLTITTSRATTTTPYTTTTPSETSSPTTPIISTTAPNFSTNAPSPTTSPSPATTSTSPTTTTPMTTTALETTTTASGSNTTSNPSALCEHEEFGTTFPNKDNSAEYIFCTGDGNYQILPCPGNNFYNPSTGNCGPKVLTTTTPASTTSASPTKLCQHEGFGASFPNHSNCAEYIFCTGDGSYQMLPCPGNNFYNPSSGTCGPNISPTLCAEIVEADLFSLNQPTDFTQNSNVCTGKANFLTLTLFHNCSEFIICYEGQPLSFTCSPGEHYNPNTENCEKSTTSTWCTKLPPNLDQ